MIKKDRAPALTESLIEYAKLVYLRIRGFADYSDISIQIMVMFP